MRKWQFLFLVSSVYGWAQPSATMTAEPNPCRIERGESECTSFIRWDTQGVERAKVFVTAEGTHKFVEKEFSTSASCESHRCRAPWINNDTKYTFQLFDFTRGDRGRLLASVVVFAEGGHRDDRGDWDHGDGPRGRIRADPNPCRTEGGQNCTAFIMWETRGVDRAKVFVTAEGRHREVEREFSTQVSCGEGQCRAPWIAPDTKYTFQLFDFTRGDRGRLLASVTVYGAER
jgi:hypothetical protein